MIRLHSVLGFAALLGFFTVTVTANAQNNGVYLQSATEAGTSTETRGWSFSIASPITITALGYFDNGSDGLVDAHQVGLWTNTGTLLASATVGAGTAPPILGGFRFTSALSGTTSLLAGTYVVAGLSTADDANVRNLAPSDVVFSEGITFISNRRNGVANEFSFPSGAGTTGPGDNTIGYFGGNFQFTPGIVAVPETSTFALALPALAMVGAVMITRRRKSA